MLRFILNQSLIAFVLVVGFAACAKDPVYGTGAGGTNGGGTGGGGGGGGHPVSACSDPQPWTAPPAPAACTDAPRPPPAAPPP